MSEPTAFVAMKFDDDPWRDRRYLAIKSVLEEAGFDAIRGDEVRSSDAVMSEVADLLQRADIVVLDSTGDSHNVSYELGFCHGVGRSAESLILLHKAGADVPFNYRHFRHLEYRNLRHLKILLRERLNCVPLRDDQLAYVLSFDLNRATGEYGFEIASAVLQALARTEFTGRCEYYSADVCFAPRIYAVGLAIRLSKPPYGTPKLTWWDELLFVTHQNLAASGQEAVVNIERSELTTLKAAKSNLLTHGSMEFKRGAVSRFFGDASEVCWLTEAASRPSY